jgi:hypothetical protein
MNSRKLKRTSNIERPTSNIEVKKRSWTSAFTSTFDVRIFFCLGATLFVGSMATADDAPAKDHPLPSLLQWEAAGAQKDPIEFIDHHMDGIVDDLGDQKTDRPVQTKQKQVVGELDAVIKQMEEQMKKKSGSGGASPNPSQPAQQSTLAKGPGGSGPLHDPKAGSKQWGDLSPKERQQIMQSQTEGFPPGYESVLASYYNRLAQEKVAADSAAAAAAPAGPAAPVGPATRPSDK